METVEKCFATAVLMNIEGTLTERTVPTVEEPLIHSMMEEVSITFNYSPITIDC